MTQKTDLVGKPRHSQQPHFLQSAEVLGRVSVPVRGPRPGLRGVCAEVDANKTCFFSVRVLKWMGNKLGAIE